MKNIFFLLLIYLFFISCKGSYTKIGDAKANYIPYYLKVYKADSLFLNGKYVESYKILDNLFKRYEPINIEGRTYEYGTYLASAVMSGNIENLKDKVIYGYENFGSISNSSYKSYYYTDSILKTINFSNAEIDSLRNIYHSKVNSNLRNEIVEMVNEDQLARNNSDAENIIKYSKIHKDKIKKILDEYGYPSYKIIGSNNGHEFNELATFDLLFLHQNNDFLEEILPFLLENVKKGKIGPEEYATIYDRYIWNKTSEIEGKQYYGSYTNKGKPSLPLKEVKKISKIRQSIGLPSLEYVLWRYNFYKSSIN
ncbi:hypothetical protein [Flavobacterium sp. HNIBRBA15423]|uniref:hypothetical protein n=1 Tax=Flavobacterium sp. HNIBRBA15423 TaxID=3458683 RepID=UPI004043D280